MKEITTAPNTSRRTFLQFGAAAASAIALGNSPGTTAPSRPVTHRKTAVAADAVHNPPGVEIALIGFQIARTGLQDFVDLTTAGPCTCESSDAAYRDCRSCERAYAGVRISPSPSDSDLLHIYGLARKVMKK